MAKTKKTAPEETVWEEAKEVEEEAVPEEVTEAEEEAVPEETEDEKKETRVQVLECSFGDANPGDEISIPKASADYYESIGYVKIIKG